MQFPIFRFKNSCSDGNFQDRGEDLKYIQDFQALLVFLELQINHIYSDCYWFQEL